MSEPIHFLKDIVDEVNSLRDPCEDTFLTPSGLRRLLLLLLRGHWSSGDNHGADLRDSLKCLEWKPDSNKSERTLDIELQGTDRAKDAGDNTIFIKVGNFRFDRQSFGNRSEVSEDNATTISTYPSICQIQCVHENKHLDAAYDMAWSTFGFFAGYAEAITEMIGLETSLDPKIIGEPQLAEDQPTGRYRVDFNMEIKLFISVSTTVESHRLKRAFDQFTP